LGRLLLAREELAMEQRLLLGLLRRVLDLRLLARVLYLRVVHGLLDLRLLARGLLDLRLGLGLGRGRGRGRELLARLGGWRLLPVRHRRPGRPQQNVAHRSLGHVRSSRCACGELLLYRRYKSKKENEKKYKRNTTV
jgi:hypothetical protein